MQTQIIKCSCFGFSLEIDNKNYFYKNIGTVAIVSTEIRTEVLIATLSINSHFTLIIKYKTISQQQRTHFQTIKPADALCIKVWLCV